MASYSTYATARRGVQWRVSWRDRAGKQRTRRGFDTEKQARNWYASHSAAGDAPEPSDMTVGQAFEVWYASQEPRWSASTRAATERLWRLHVSDEWAERLIQAATAADVQNWVNWIEPRHSASAVSRMLTILRGCLAVAEGAGVVRENVAKFASVPPGENSEREPRRVITRGQADLLADAAYKAARVQAVGIHRRALIRLMSATGLAFGELAALEARDIMRDGEGRPVAVRVSRRATEVDGVVSVTPTRGAARREVGVPLWVQGDLSEALSTAGEGLLWPTGRGTPRRSPGRGGWWSEALSAAREVDPNIPAKLTVGDLRHCAATQMIAAGVPVGTLAQQLGHASPTVTRSVYSDILPDPLDAVRQIK